MERQIRRPVFAMKRSRVRRDKLFSKANDDQNKAQAEPRPRPAQNADNFGLGSNNGFLEQPYQPREKRCNGSVCSKPGNRTGQMVMLKTNSRSIRSVSNPKPKRKRDRKRKKNLMGGSSRVRPQHSDAHNKRIH